MTSVPTAVEDQDGGVAPGLGDEEVGVMNEGDMDYIERPQEQGAYAEISDHQGNNFQVSLEDLAAVGVDVNKGQLEISEEQMNMLLSMMNQDGLPAGAMGTEEYEDSAGNDQITISIQSDGGIKLVTTGGHESFFSPSQLAEINIDTQNLTDDDIKRVVQLAAAATGESLLYDEERPEKRRKIEASNSGMEERRERETAVRMQPIQRSYQSVHMPTHSAASTSSGHISVPSSNLGPPRGMPNGRRGQGGLVGESVKIQNAKGNIVPAVVRYTRPGNGTQPAAYKVQTADGKFEWINQDRIIGRVPRTVDVRDYDHNRYTSEPPVSILSSGPSTSSGGSILLSRRLFPAGGGGGGMGPRGLPIRPMPLPHHQLHQHPPNFCCPVCDRKVYQKEPAYIVIRLPACDSCTREKILIVDDNAKGGGQTVGAGGAVSTGRPSMRSIATDTSDLPRENETSEEVPPTNSPSEEQPMTPEDVERRRSEEAEGDRSAEEEAGSMDESDGLQSPLVSQPQEVSIS